MSTAWKGPVVLLREPASALWSRLGYRLLLTGLLALAAWYAPWALLAAIAWTFAVLMALLAALAVANVVKNKRVVLVHTGAGSIEWPRSIQEILLRRPLTWVAGRDIAVVHPPVAAMPGKADPRVTLGDGTRLIERVPLYGMAPATFVEAANGLLTGRGTSLHLEEPPAIGVQSPE